MKELGMKDKIFGVELLKDLTVPAEPTEFPRIPEGHSVICGFDQGLGERMIVCETLEDMQRLDKAYGEGMALDIHWYHGPDPGFVAEVVLPAQ